jgi:hypothetical protein
MIKRVRSLTLATLIGPLLLSAIAVANASPAHSPVSKQLSGTPCSVTATFTPSPGLPTMTYGGGVSCAGGVGQKTVDVVPQVFNVVNGKPLWFDISLAGRYAGPTPINPLRVTGSTRYVSSHTYRLLVYGLVTLPNGRSATATACSGDCMGPPMLTIGSSYTYRAEPPGSAPLPGIPCSVGQNGLVFTLVNGTYVIDYGGYSGCDGTIRAVKNMLTVCVQVVDRINGRAVWFTVAGSCLSMGPKSVNFLQVATARTGFLGHGYRIVASATVQYPTSHGTLTRSATVHSAVSGP